jgi:hypothetical protein
MQSIPETRSKTLAARLIIRFAVKEPDMRLVSVSALILAMVTSSAFAQQSAETGPNAEYHSYANLSQKFRGLKQPSIKAIPNTRLCIDFCSSLLRQETVKLEQIEAVLKIVPKMVRATSVDYSLGKDLREVSSIAKFDRSKQQSTSIDSAGGGTVLAYSIAEADPLGEVVSIDSTLVAALPEGVTLPAWRYQRLPTLIRGGLNVRGATVPDVVIAPIGSPDDLATQTGPETMKPTERLPETAQTAPASGGMKLRPGS